MGSIDDFKEMAGILANVKANFILSINDHPEILDTFKRFNIKPITLNYSAPKGKQTKGKELLVNNF